MKLFSIVICTYNRSNQLRVILESLETQLLSHQLYEVLIVDNNSSDNTAETAQKYCDQYTNWRYVFEPKQGLSNARNRGWNEAVGTYVAYTDDDCKVPPEWLLNAKTVVEQKAPGIFGGPYFPFYQSTRPTWFKDDYYSKETGENPHELSSNEYISGGNMFIRHDLLKKIAGFNADLGMRGGAIGVGEEVALQNWVRINLPNEIIYSDPKVFVYHLVPEHKMKLFYRAKRSFVEGRYSWNVFNLVPPQGRYRIIYGLFRSVFYFTKHCLILVRSLFLDTLIRDRSVYPYFQNYWFEISFRSIYHIGKHLEYGNLFFRRRM